MENEKIIDISPPIDSTFEVWPGDVSYSRYVSLDIGEGDRVTLSSIKTTLHLGAHADAPSHYSEKGSGIGNRPLHFYYGRCQILEVKCKPGARIFPKDIPRDILAPRVLFKTGSFADRKKYDASFNGLSAPLIEFLRGKGVVLVGIDTPSIDLFDDKKMESHKAAIDSDIAILEGLQLDHVSPGVYMLCALPLRLLDADASPVRAVLIE